jgi:hypothetical protein
MAMKEHLSGARKHDKKKRSGLEMENKQKQDLKSTKGKNVEESVLKMNRPDVYFENEIRSLVKKKIWIRYQKRMTNTTN